jgi:hypothetical protein
MEIGLSKTLGTMFVSIMSFLGWQVDEYKIILPKNVEEFVKEVSIKKENIETEDKKETKNKNLKIEEPKKPKPVETPIIKVEVPKQIIPEKKPEPSERKVDVEINPNIGKEAVVNIYCTLLRGSKIQTITGSAVSIGEDGVYLTNAHIGIYVMLEEFLNKRDINCYLREGSPAKNTYTLKTIFIPPTWVETNKNHLKLISPTGTGENDYAILKRDKPIRENGVSQANIKTLKISKAKIKEDDEVILSGYPVENEKTIQNGLYKVTEKTQIKRLMNFGNKNIDSIDTSPTTLAKVGSSGGAMIDYQGNLLGIMVATTIDKYSGRKNIKGITLSYIDKDIEGESGSDLIEILEDNEEKGKIFRSKQLPRLSEILINGSK